MHDQTVGQDLQEGLYGEDDEEDVLHLLLKYTWEEVVIRVVVMVMVIMVV